MKCWLLFFALLFGCTCTIFRSNRTVALVFFSLSISLSSFMVGRKKSRIFLLLSVSPFLFLCRDFSLFSLFHHSDYLHNERQSLFHHEKMLNLTLRYNNFKQLFDSIMNSFKEFHPNIAAFGWFFYENVFCYHRSLDEMFLMLRNVEVIIQKCLSLKKKNLKCQKIRRAEIKSCKRVAEKSRKCCAWIKRVLDNFFSSVEFCFILYRKKNCCCFLLNKNSWLKIILF